MTLRELIPLITVNAGRNITIYEEVENTKYPGNQNKYVDECIEFNVLETELKTAGYGKKFTNRVTKYLDRDIEWVNISDATICLALKEK